MNNDDGQDLKSQKTINLVDFAQKPNSEGGLFNNLSIPKKPAQAIPPEKLKAPVEDKKSNPFTTIASGNLFG